MSFNADAMALDFMRKLNVAYEAKYAFNPMKEFFDFAKAVHAAGLEAGRKEENEACAQEIRSYIFEKGLSDELLDIAAFIESRVPGCDQYHCGHPKCNERKEKQKQTAGFA